MSEEKFDETGARPPSETDTGTETEEETPSQRAWRRTSEGHKLLYRIYVIPLLLIPLGILALFASPIYILVRSSRPFLWHGQAPDPNYPDSPYEWYGPGKDYPPGLALASLGHGPGFKRRLWEMYGHYRELMGMCAKQGLQVVGVIIGLALLVMQVEMMWHDYTADSIVSYRDAVGEAADNASSTLKTDSTCAYAVGTGIANWGTGSEPLAWYGSYHGFLCILCICLICDEIFNVRFGCFAPQWNRAGIGYTIMFLVSATLTTSANWGLTDLIQLRYYCLVFFFLVGVYNVLRTLFANGGLTTDEFRHTDYRVGRKPLRLWTEEEWADPYYRRNFIPDTYERYFLTERIQARIGDWNFPLMRRSREDIEAQREELRRLGIDDGRVQKVYRRDDEEYVFERGKMGRAIWHGGPKHMPYFMVNDLEQRKRMHKGPIDPDNLPSEEEEKEMIKIWRKDKGYFGLANWKPVTKSYGWWWFDVRRAAAIALGFALLSLRIGFYIFELSSSNWAAYHEQYTSTKTSWAGTGGPDAIMCQYYEGSSLPIFVITGDSALSGANANMLWFGLWNTFLIGMCLSVILVATSNNMFWGMHWPFPCINLIGPRMTSMSMGVTIGFVSCATLQQGFFFNDSSLIMLTRIICYSGLGLFFISWFPNEQLLANYTRDPFWPWTSRYAFRFMDRKKWNSDWRDAESIKG